MIASGVTVASSALDLPGTAAPDETQFNAYTEAWQQQSAQAQGWANGSPAALSDDAMTWLSRAQPNWQPLAADLRTIDVSTAPAGQPATSDPPPSSDATNAATRPANASSAALHLMLETFDYGFHAAIVTTAVTQLTGSVNTLVKQS